MRIGIVEDDIAILDWLEVGLTRSGDQVTIYNNAKDCIAAILWARFNNEPLPHDILVVDLDLQQGIGCEEMLQKLRQFITSEELPCLITSSREIIELNLLDNQPRVNGLKARWHPHVKMRAHQPCSRR